MEEVKDVKNSEKIQNDNKVKPLKKEPAQVNCLRNERIIVRYIPKETALVKNPKHVLYGGMAENATRIFTIPKLSSGMFVNVLTDSEKSFLEEVMGLEFNALSIYKKVNNFWDDSNDVGISEVVLHKQDNYFDLSYPEDYIKYKILLANKDFIAPSLSALQNTPKATYQFVIISEGEENKVAVDNMTATMKCYKLYGKIEDDADTLRTIIEIVDGRPVSSTTKLETLQTKINNIIQSNSKLFLNVVEDPMLYTKVLLKKSIEKGLVLRKGDYLYLNGAQFDGTNSPLCEDGEEPTTKFAVKYLNLPKNQTLKLTLEAKLK